MASTILPGSFVLPDGVHLPAIGLGTFQGEEGNSQVREVVAKALSLGYRHLDGAAAYGNEREIGEGIRDSGIPREEIFITSKLSLNDLQVDFVDLYLMHFPHAYSTDSSHNTLRHQDSDAKRPVIDFELSRMYTATWRAMEELVDNGKAKFIGLSNFNILKTKRILEIARIRPVVNQVELHPYLPQKELVAFCHSEHIMPVAHQPLGGRPVAAVNPNASRPGPIMDKQVLHIASEIGKTPAQVLLSWLIQRGIPSVPKSAQEDHLKQNLNICKLSDDHFQRLNNISDLSGTVRYLDPLNHIGFDIFDEDEDQPVY
ncbi:MAG: hypothetical protein M1821_008645 [Bathelium mastoideum]|nr:MAG: hypothetical protein M1821_008645 [Bathelium mastoideum]